MVNSLYLLVPILLGIGFLLHASLFLNITKPYRTIISGAAACALLFSGAALVTFNPALITFGIALVHVYMCLNLLRFAEGRKNDEQLKEVAGRSWLVFMLYDLVLFGGWAAWHASGRSLTLHSLLLPLLLVSTTLSLWGLAGTALRIFKFHWQKVVLPLSDKKLPTISLVIPARNETAALNTMLDAALASNYPKIEILVLDDSSQDNTAQIIKSYANRGVRFVKGTTPPDDHWLHKNWAYETLSNAATGQYIVFAGVDVHLEPHTLRDVIETMIEQKLTMVSVMPKRYRGAFLASFVQPIRYWWELILPRGLLRRPPVLSTFWCIEAKALNKLGGFKAVARSVIPERYFARELKQKGSYQFWIATMALGLETTKSLHDQVETAIRLRYPQVRHRPESVMALVLLEAIVWLLPMAGLVVALWAHVPLLLIILSAISVGASMITYTIVAALTNPNSWFLAPITFPFVIGMEMVLLHVSMYQYEFGQVLWKGRNVEAPVMKRKQLSRS